MKTICLIEAVGGMLLAQEVSDDRGNLLVAKNTVLTPALISSLQAHGVTRVTVEDEIGGIPAKTYSEQELAGIRSECRMELEKRFAHTPVDAMMQALFHAILNFMVGQRTRGDD